MEEERVVREGGVGNAPEEEEVVTGKGRSCEGEEWRLKEGGIEKRNEQK
jgi:hypothetical protein